MHRESANARHLGFVATATSVQQMPGVESETRRRAAWPLVLQCPRGETVERGRAGSEAAAGQGVQNQTLSRHIVSSEIEDFFSRSRKGGSKVALQQLREGSLDDGRDLLGGIEHDVHELAAT